MGIEKATGEVTGVEIGKWTGEVTGVEIGKWTGEVTGTTVRRTGPSASSILNFINELVKFASNILKLY